MSRLNKNKIRSDWKWFHIITGLWTQLVISCTVCHVNHRSTETFQDKNNLHVLPYPLLCNTLGGCRSRLILARVWRHTTLWKRSEGEASACPLCEPALLLILLQKSTLIKPGLLHSSLASAANEIISFIPLSSALHQEVTGRRKTQRDLIPDPTDLFKGLDDQQILFLGMFSCSRGPSNYAQEENVL